MLQVDALVLFDIDGTLIRRAGPHHREALITAVRKVLGVETSLDNVPVAGMLDRDILTQMMLQAGLSRREIRSAMPDIIRHAQLIYPRSCPDLRRKVCPGVRTLLSSLVKSGATTALVTGNLSRIAWKKMERAGLSKFFQFGAFAEDANTRAALARQAIQRARRDGHVNSRTAISLIGDHPNDIQAARKNGVRSIAVGTGLVPVEQLRLHSPDILVPDMRSLRLESFQSR